MNEAEYGSSLWIDTGDEHPNIITEITGIKATEIEVKGEFIVMRNGIKKPLKQNLWGLKPPVHIAEDEYELPNCINDIIDILDSKESAFREVFGRFNNYKLLIYSNAYTRWIQFRIEPEILYRMAKYQLAIDFSIWSFEPDEENVLIEKDGPFLEDQSSK